MIKINLSYFNRLSVAAHRRWGVSPVASLGSRLGIMSLQHKDEAKDEPATQLRRRHHVAAASFEYLIVVRLTRRPAAPSKNVSESPRRLSDRPLESRQGGSTAAVADGHCLHVSIFSLSGGATAALVAPPGIKIRESKGHHCRHCGRIRELRARPTRIQSAGPHSTLSAAGAGPFLKRF